MNKGLFLMFLMFLMCPHMYEGECDLQGSLEIGGYIRNMGTRPVFIERNFPPRRQAIRNMADRGGV